MFANNNMVPIHAHVSLHNLLSIIIIIFHDNGINEK